jgi:succinate dehydrogenase/fumarate reductase flavoprotein subunit
MTSVDQPSWGSEWDRVADVIVVGSGVAGCAAAVAAARRGSSVVILEKTAFPGGTTAKSGGVLWICDNPVMRAQGLVDERATALQYLARTAYPTMYASAHPTLGLPDAAYRLLEAFYDEGGDALDELATAGVLALEGVDYPDYYADLDEDTAPRGRAVQAIFPPGWRRGLDPTGGQYLVEHLRAGAEQLGAELLLEHQVVHVLHDDDGLAIGVEVRVGRRTVLIGARQAIVFGSGGFLHNDRLTRAFLRGPVLGGGAAEGSTGDFVDIGIELDAQLGNMSHAWWDQVVVEHVVRVPETIRDVYSPFGDSMIMVNRYGRRVVNEKVPYNERGQIHFHWDPSRREYTNLLLFMLFDDDVANSTEPSRFRFPVPDPGDHPDHVISAPTWPELAAAIAARLEVLAPHIGGVRLDAGFTTELATSVARFNSMAVDGRDLDFSRGETPIEQTWGMRPRDGMPSGSMHPFAPQGPYHCVIVGPGALDTKGGPVIDERARVVGSAGQPIPRIYGAGNCIASPAGQSYWGPGATIGLAFTFGWIAGCNAASERRFGR